MTIDVFTDEVTTSNCYVLGDGSGALVVDPNAANGVRDILAHRGLSLEVIMLTHEHCDHIAALEELRGETGAPVVCSEACSEGIGNITQNVSRIMEVYLYFLHGREIRYAPFKCRPAEITYAGEFTYTWRSHEIRCTPLPGHSPGSSVLMLDGEVFSGDYLLPDEKVVTRLPGGDTSTYERVAAPFLASIPLGSTIRPGHGASYRLTEVTDHGS